jgi:hypothetical protein
VLTIPEYYESLIAEYERQQKSADYYRWQVYSGALNRKLRKLIEANQNDRRQHAMNTIAFSLWQEYDAKLRGDKLDANWEKRVEQYTDVLTGKMDISEIIGPLS